MTKKKQISSFDKDLLRLEEISEALENEDVGLDEAIKLFEEGIKLSKSCLSTLKKAELKITELKEEISEFNFDEEE